MILSRKQILRQITTSASPQVLLLATGLLFLTTASSGCSRKSGPLEPGGTAANQPSRISGSPYPVSRKPDTLFVVDESTLTYTQILTVESLQGILAQSRPEIYVINGNTDSYAIWLSDLVNTYGVTAEYTYSSDFAGLLRHFKSEISGYILTTTTEPSIDIAFSEAGLKDAIVVAASDEPTVTGLGITELTDVTNATYQEFFSEYQGMMNKDALCYQTAANEKAQYLPDYAIFGKMFFYYGDISSPLTSQIFSTMNSNSALLGWGNDEFSLVRTASQNSIMVHAADFAKDLSALSNFGVEEKQASHITNPATIDSVHTVCFVMTDGDNIQWVLNNFDTDQNWYASPDRREVNLGWTISPALCELAPTVMKRFYDSEGKSEGGRDYFIAGPSGLGYMYPESYKDLASYASLTASFMEKADLHIVNVIGSSNPPAVPTSNLVPYLNQQQIDAVFYYPYSNYAGCGGQITWANGKPIITARYNLWSPQYESPQTLAAKLNSLSTDITSAGGYSLVDVHVWTQSVADVANCVKLLDKHVRVVAPDEFVELIEKNVKH